MRITDCKDDILINALELENTWSWEVAEDEEYDGEDADINGNDSEMI